MTQPRFVWAVFNFPGTTEEDLPLVAGERVEVLSRDDEFGDGWWEGINSSGQQGLFPKIYTSAVSPENGSSDNTNFASQSLERLEEEHGSEVSTTHSHDIDAGDRSAFHGAPPRVDNVSQWTPDEVAQHFEHLGLGDVSSQFLRHNVDGEILLSMQHADLRKVEITSFSKRFEIMQEIDQLKNSSRMVSPAMLQSENGNSTPPLAVVQRFDPHMSMVMPQDSATGSVLQGGSPQSSRTDTSSESQNGIEPLVPRSNYYKGDLAPAIGPGDALYRRSDSGLGSSDISSTPDLGPPSSATNTATHRKSMSASSLSFTAVGSEVLNGKRSPDKGHARAWSQDTMKTGPHRRGVSGNLDSVDEASASMISTDSTPRTPSSTLESPVSGIGASTAISPVSPNLSKGPVLLPKRSILSRKPKWRPNAVSENLEQISAPDSAKGADFCGWLRKRGERSYNWKLRYFVLRGTRLAYFQNDQDTSEKGLIDINSHRVVPVDDILSFGPTKHVFKLLPPAPGASRALNFTPPKTHIFCADSREQMKQWITVFTKATIGRDWSTPVISSCTTKTISLKAARDLRVTGKPSDIAVGALRGNESDQSSAVGLQSPPMLTPEELVAQQQANKNMRPISGHIARNLSISSDSSLRRAVLQVSQEN